MTDVIEIHFEVKTIAWVHPEAEKIYQELIQFVLDKGYQVARKGSGRGSRTALLHPIGTKLS